jgi:hypothetical protein
MKKLTTVILVLVLLGAIGYGINQSQQKELDDVENVDITDTSVEDDVEQVDEENEDVKTHFELDLEYEVIREVSVSNAEELMAALNNAQPGDKIILKSGDYVGNKSLSGDSKGFFYSGMDGTEQNPIIIESEDMNNPAVLKGTTTTTGYVLYLTGDYWMVNHLKIENGQKGIMLDNSNHTIIHGVEVYNIGQEAVHFRDGSSHNIIDQSYIHDTGLHTAGYGEGIYVGSDKGKWETFDKSANFNIIQNNILGPNVSAEHIDIKEGTIGTVIKNNTFNGTGITGEHYADSFIDTKGNDALIQNNVFYRNNNAMIVDGIQIRTQLTGWGFRNEFHDNVFHLDTVNVFGINLISGSAKASNNTRHPEGSLYRGNVQIID